ncbi:MAG: TAXI family TRAP transporter solute-binding subunit, partial [Planctomycetes bacterium]|nr:TAXI family TRAP transporter solute-binding subunit [Planctomycetota bacterium]
MRHAPWLLSVLGATLVFALAGCGDGNSANTAGGTQRYVVVSGGTSGVYYPTATAITRLAGRVDPNLVIDVQTSGGSVANARKLGQGNAHLAMMQNDIAAYARSGQEMFDEPIDTIVGVAALYPEHIQLVAHADSGVRRIADLRGKRVAIGDIGSGTEANARQILRAHGLSVDDLGKVERLTATESRQYLQDRRIDVAFFTFGVGTAAIQDLARNSDIRLVPIDGVQRRTLIDQHGFYRAAVVPAGAYEGLDT